MSKADSYVDILPHITKAQLLSAILAVALASTIAQLPDWYYDYSLTGERAANKVFRTFSDFYPFYLSEHDHMTNRLLHLCGTTLSLIIMLWHPVLIQSLAASFGVGYLICNLMSGWSTGIVEGVIMLSTFLLLAKANGALKYAIVRYMSTYTCQWLS